MTRRVLRRSAIVVAASLMLLSGVPAAEAQTSPASDTPPAVILVPRLGPTITTQATATATCWSRSLTLEGTDPLPSSGYWFTAWSNWCAGPKLQTISSVSWGQYGTTQGFWSYIGVSGDVRGGGVGSSYAYRRVYGHFQWCLGAVCNHNYPWIAWTVRANGTSTVDWGMG